MEPKDQPVQPAGVGQGDIVVVTPPPGPGGCDYQYRVSVSPDSVPAGSPGQIVFVHVKILDKCHPPTSVSDVQIAFQPSQPYEEDFNTGMVEIDSLPPEDEGIRWFFQFRDPEISPSPPSSPWTFSILTDSNGEATIPYRTSGVPGVDPIDMFPSDIRFETFGPAIDLDITVISSELSVDCVPNPVIRAETIECAASVPAESSLEILDWTFSGGGHTILEETTEVTWEGAMVVSGTVTVRALVDDSLMTASADVNVTSRDWSQLFTPLTISEIVPSGLPLRPRAVAQLGNVGFRPGQESNVVRFLIQVGTGPNTGLVYLDDIPFNITAEIRINRGALSVGSDFWTLQAPNRVGQFCSRSDVVPFVAIVERHEGLPPVDPASHVALFKGKLDSLVGPDLEDIVRPSQASLLGEASSRFRGILPVAQTESDLADRPPLVPVYCLFRYFSP